MKIFICTILALISEIGYSKIFPQEEWESGKIDLGNGGDEIFYIYFKARNKNASAPIILYMAGGPGTSGEFNLLFETGPLKATEHETIVYNPYSWNEFADLIFVDQPVGVGFSTAKNNDTVCKNHTCVVHNMYIFLIKLYAKHYDFVNKPLYLSGVSYAGHYVPSLASCIVKHKNEDIKFKGILIGGPFIDSELFFHLDPYYLWQKGIFNWEKYVYFISISTMCKISRLIDQDKAYNFCSEYNDYKDDATNLINQNNIESNRTYDNEYRIITKFWNDTEVQKDLGVCCKNFKTRNYTSSNFLRTYDYLVHYIPFYEDLLQHDYPITLMYGDADYTCNYMSGLLSAERFNWDGQQGFKDAKWEEIYIDGELQALKKQYKKLTFYRIFHAGHLIPKDKPEFALKILQVFINQNP